jgi:cytochrome c biogenesis factor
VLCFLLEGRSPATTATRALVQMPARERLGAVPWAEHTRAEHDGLGVVFYDLVGGIALLFTVATAIAFRLDRTMRRSRRLPIYAAIAISGVAGVVTRMMIVPADFQMRAAGDNAAVELQTIFQHLAPWWGVNDVLHIVAFGFTLWALMVIVSRRDVPQQDARKADQPIIALTASGKDQGPT